MQDPQQALAAARRSAPAARGSGRRVLVLGGGGHLGAEVLEQLLAAGAFDQVGVLTRQALQPALRGLLPVPEDDPQAAGLRPDSAVIVFDRQRHANGRDDAFVQPLPADLARWAARLQALGVRCLVVVVPHAPGLLPQALKAGLASLDEGAAAALGLPHLVFMRSAQGAGVGAAAAALPARVAGWMLAQLHWLLPQTEQPVRRRTVARVAARLAAALPASAPGTRVLAPEWLWAAAQTGAPGGATDAVVDAWLAGQPLPQTGPAAPRWAGRAGRR